MNNQKVKIYTGLIFSILAVIVLVLFVDLKEVWENLRKLSWFIIIVVLVLYLINMFIRALRWQIIIKQGSDCRLNMVFRGMVYGYMLNQLLPAKMGEIGRAEYLTRKTKGSRSFFLGTIVVERIFDIAIISLFLGFSILFSRTVMDNLKSNLVPVIALLLVFFGAVILLFNLEFLKRFTRYLPGRAELFVDHVIDNVVQAFSMFNSWSKVQNILLLSLFIWGATCFTFYLILLDLDLTLPFYAYFFIVSAGTFGMIIPSTSANVGVYHAVATSALLIFMVPKDEALTFAIVAHAFDFFPSVILGSIIFIYNRRISLRSVQNFEKVIPGNQETI